jgi:hypothetical protein
MTLSGTGSRKSVYVHAHVPNMWRMSATFPAGKAVCSVWM